MARRRGWMIAGLVGLALVVLIVGGGVAFVAYQRAFYMRKVPPGVEVSRVARIASNGFCGVVIYDASYVVDYRGMIAPEFHVAWRETPIPAKYSTTEAMDYPRYPLGLVCAERLGRDRNLIARAASYPGSYYFETATGVFLLMPQERWLVFSFFD